MRNSIVILAVLNCTCLFAQQPLFLRKDTLIFAPDSSYSRSVVRDGENLIFATSKNGVVEFNEETGIPKLLFPPSESGEFRAVMAHDHTIVAMVSGDNGEVVATAQPSQGITAKQVMNEPGVFLDDIAGFKHQIVALGDPAGHEFQIFITDNTLNSYKAIAAPVAIGDEACYAASGTTILFPSASQIAFISGGSAAVRFHVTNNLGETWASVDLPMKKGEGCGPFSMHFTSKKNGMIVGGCYTAPNSSEQSSLYSTDGGKTWNVSETCTGGYRSCVTGTKNMQFACGTNGLDISTDGGRNWKPFDKGNFCALLLEKNFLYATTNKGKCIRYQLR